MKGGVQAMVSCAAAGLLLTGGVTPAAATDHVRQVFLHKPQTRCVHVVNETGFTLSKGTDRSLWDVSNRGRPNASGGYSDPCGQEQFVILCTYTADASGVYVYNEHAFETCSSSPTPGLTFNAAFRVPAGQEESLKCRGKTEGKTKLVVQSGGTPPRCKKPNPPASQDQQKKVLHHTIQIEIVP